jgi:hypothetical protein
LISHFDVSQFPAKEMQTDSVKISDTTIFVWNASAVVGWGHPDSNIRLTFMRERTAFGRSLPWLGTLFAPAVGNILSQGQSSRTAVI